RAALRRDDSPPELVAEADDGIQVCATRLRTDRVQDDQLRTPVVLGAIAPAERLHDVVIPTHTAVNTDAIQNLPPLRPMPTTAGVAPKGATPEGVGRATRQTRAGRRTTS